MSEYSRRWVVPMHDMSSLRITLRNIAENEDRAERLRLHELLASQFEVMLNQIGNNTQIALWSAQEEAYRKIDHLHEQTANTNTLLSAVIEAVNGLRGVVEASASEAAARLGKIEARLDRKRDELDDHERRLRLIERHLGLGDG